MNPRVGEGGAMVKVAVFPEVMGSTTTTGVSVTSLGDSPTRTSSPTREGTKETFWGVSNENSMSQFAPAG